MYGFVEAADGAATFLWAGASTWVAGVGEGELGSVMDVFARGMKNQKEKNGGAKSAQRTQTSWEKIR